MKELIKERLLKGDINWLKENKNQVREYTKYLRRDHPHRLWAEENLELPKEKINRYLGILTIGGVIIIGILEIIKRLK